MLARKAVRQCKFPIARQPKKTALYASLANRFNWPPSLPNLPGAQLSRLHEQWGRAVNQSALCYALTQVQNTNGPDSAAELLDQYGADSTAKVIAMSLPLQSVDGDYSTAYYKYLGSLAEQKGQNAAVEWAIALYTPFVANSCKLHASPQLASAQLTTPPFRALHQRMPAPSTEPIERSPPPAPAQTGESAQLTRASPDRPIGPVDLGSTEGMSLFDPESWLVDSPTAQRIWQESR